MEYQENWTTGVQDTRGHVWPCVGQFSGVEINTGPVARGQWICCRASEICNSLARLACKILKPNFWDYMV